jgi:hypothetical protein
MFFYETDTTINLYAEDPNKMGNGHPRTVAKVSKLQRAESLLARLESRGHLALSTKQANRFTTRLDINTITGFLKLAVEGRLAPRT